MALGLGCPSDKQIRACPEVNVNAPFLHDVAGKLDLHSAGQFVLNELGFVTALRGRLHHLNDEEKRNQGTDSSGGKQQHSRKDAPAHKDALVAHVRKKVAYISHISLPR